MWWFFRQVYFTVVGMGFTWWALHVVVPDLPKGRCIYAAFLLTMAHDFFAYKHRADME